MKARTPRRHAAVRAARNPDTEPLDTEALRTQLVSIRERILHRVDHVAGDLDALHEIVPAELEEDAQEQHIADVLRRLGERDRRELALIDAALARLVAGGYGICAVCEEPIPPARLAVLPTAAACVECAEAAARTPRHAPVEAVEPVEAVLD